LGEEPESGLERIRVIRIGEYIYGDCCGSYWVNCRSWTNFLATFSHRKMQIFWQKNCWVLIWAILSQTHLVTLERITAEKE
jgi:hypothetical protein